jgi:sugar-specific transcriptional regulator TrmB
MTTDPQFELEELGLLPAEAQVYLALTRNGPLVASAIAHLTEIPRSSVYPTLNALVDKGLVEAGAGYGSRFKAVPSETALPALIRREREQLSHREAVVKGLSEHLATLAEPRESVPDELIQVLRNPRAVAQRYEKLQLEAEQKIEVLCKPPFFVGGGHPAEEKALRRGVRNRAIYERAALEDPAVKPYLSNWLSKGEEARIYDGVLPHKLAILIQHAQLAQMLSLGFQYLWEQSEPLTPMTFKKTSAIKSSPSKGKTNSTKKATASTDRRKTSSHLTNARNSRHSHHAKQRSTAQNRTSKLPSIHENKP